MQDGGGIDVKSGASATRSGNLSLSTASPVLDQNEVDGSVTTGSIEINTGDVSSGTSGSVSIQTGHAPLGKAGDLSLQVGTGISGGGKVNISAGSIWGEAAQGGSVNLAAGSGASGGNLTIRSGEGSIYHGGALILESGPGGESSGNISIATGLNSASCKIKGPGAQWRSSMP